MTSSANSPNKLGAIDFSHPRIFLAPMEGVVDHILRDMIAAQNSADVCVTEFVRITTQLLPKSVYLRYCPELEHNCETSGGVPVLVQLLGSDPAAMAENAAFATEIGARGIDLNFGCPAKTVNNHDGGASLLKIPERLFHVISAVRAAVPAEFSVSAKVRLGFDNKNYVTDIAQACNDAGASWMTVHARTKVDGYRPPAYWEYIRQMREAVKIPVIANGEIWNTNDYHRCREVSGSEHVMLGRGLVANPGLGWEIKNGAAKKPWSSWQNFTLEFMQRSEASRHENFAVQRTKQLVKMMGQAYGEAAVFLEKIKRLQTTTEIRTEIEHHWQPVEGVETIAAPRVIVAKKFQTEVACG